MNKERGFTIVELLVTISIIAVLSGIVVVNVSQYVNKGKNTAIRGNLATIQTNGTVYFYTYGDYQNFCSDPLYLTPAGAANNAGTGIVVSCSVDGAHPPQTWCVCSNMLVTSGEPLNSTLCIDSTGYKKVTQNGKGCSASKGRCGATAGPAGTGPGGTCFD